MDRLNNVVEPTTARRRRSLIGLMLMVGWASAAAQSLPAPLRGVVYDPSGLPVERAVVRVLSPDGTVVAETTSGPDGRWTLQTDPASPRILTIDLTGFAGVRRPIDATSPGVGAIEPAALSRACARLEGVAEDHWRRSSRRRGLALPIVRG